MSRCVLVCVLKVLLILQASRFFAFASCMHAELLACDHDTHRMASVPFERHLIAHPPTYSREFLWILEKKGLKKRPFSSPFFKYLNNEFLEKEFFGVIFSLPFHIDTTNYFQRKQPQFYPAARLPEFTVRAAAHQAPSLHRKLYLRASMHISTRRSSSVPFFSSLLAFFFLLSFL